MDFLKIMTLLKSIIPSSGGEKSIARSDSPVTLKFPREIEDAFLSNYFEITVTRVRPAVALGVFLYGLFYFLDYFLMPDVRGAFFIIRFGFVIPVGILVYALSFSGVFRRFYQFLSFTYTLIAGLGIVSMTLVRPQYTEAYYVGIILVLIYTYIISGLRFYWASASGATVVLSYIIGINLVATPSWSVHFDNFFFLISSNLLLMVGVYYFELFYRREFQLQYQLNQKRQEIEKINISLESRVTERTQVLKEEILERMIARQEAQHALEEKELLLREVNHRTKNSMNVIISLLNMQSAEYKKRPVENVFKQVSERIYSMFLIHEQLYRSDDLSTIQFAQYMRELVFYIQNSGDQDWSGINVHYECEAVEIGLEEAVPLGLAVNEIITNTFKHGYPSGGKGQIRIRMRATPVGKLILRIDSDGLCFPEAQNIEEPETLGLRLIRILIEDQLQSKLSIVSEGSVTYSIELLPSDSE